jgi:hypothetical protein
MSQFCWFRCTFSNGRYSTTEKHYYSVPTETIDPAAITVMQQYLQRRIMLLGGNCYLDDLEIGDDLNPQSTIKIGSFGHAVGVAPLPPGAAPASSPNPLTVSPAVQIGTAYYQVNPNAPLPPLDFGVLAGGKPPPTPNPDPPQSRIDQLDAELNAYFREQARLKNLSSATAGTMGLIAGTAISKPPAPKAYNPAFNPPAGLGGLQELADFAYSCLMVRKESARPPINYHGSMYLEGNPDVIQTTGRNLPTDANWLTAFAAVNQLWKAGLPLGMKVQLRGPGGIAPARIVNVVVNAYGSYSYTLAAPVPVLPGQRFRASGVHGLFASNVNGDRVMATGSLPTLLVCRSPQATGTFLFRQGGLATLVGYLVVPYSRWVMQSFRVRKRGSSADGVRGSKSHRRKTST